LQHTNDETNGRDGNLHPGSESGTCFRTNGRGGGWIDGDEVPAVLLLAEDKSQRYPFVPRLSAVDDRRVAVGGVGSCRNRSRLGVRDMHSRH
jgi:hypothetical protein